MLGDVAGAHRKTVGADKNFDTTEFVTACRSLNVTAHVAQNTYEYNTSTGKRARRRSRIDGRTTRHPGYAVSQVIRKMIETLFGDGKQHGGTIRQVKLRGRNKVSRCVHAGHARGESAPAARPACGEGGDGWKWVDGRGVCPCTIGLEIAANRTQAKPQTHAIRLVVADSSENA